MSRYVTRPTAGTWFPPFDEDVIDRSSIDVHPSPGRPTGLLDAHGNEIWSVPDPIGFVRFRDAGKGSRTHQE